MSGHLAKRSVTLGGHRTSIALEPAFWEALDRLAAQQGRPLAGLIAEVDAGRADPSLPLASRLRTWLLEAAIRGALQPASAQAAPSPPPHGVLPPDPSG